MEFHPVRFLDKDIYFEPTEELINATQIILAAGRSPRSIMSLLGKLEIQTTHLISKGSHIRGRYVTFADGTCLCDHLGIKFPIPGTILEQLQSQRQARDFPEDNNISVPGFLHASEFERELLAGWDSAEAQHPEETVPSLSQGVQGEEQALYDSLFGSPA